MGRFLRFLFSANVETWDEATKAKASWCPADDIPASLLEDWCDSQLSLWLVDDKHLEDIKRAILDQRKNWEKVNLLFFDESLLKSAGIKPQPSKGTSNLEHLDEKYHYDLVKFTSNQLTRLLLQLIQAYKDKGPVTIQKWKLSEHKQSMRSLMALNAASTATKKPEITFEGSTAAEPALPNIPTTATVPVQSAGTAIPTNESTQPKTL